MGDFNKVKVIKNQTRQCKLIEERMNEAWEKTNRQSAPIPVTTKEGMDDFANKMENYSNLSKKEYEDDYDEDEASAMPAPQPIDKYGRPIKKSSSNSGCIIS